LIMSLPLLRSIQRCDASRIGGPPVTSFNPDIARLTIHQPSRSRFAGMPELKWT
jgi:hypothetical protein